MTSDYLQILSNSTRVLKFLFLVFCEITIFYIEYFVLTNVLNKLDFTFFKIKRNIFMKIGFVVGKKVYFHENNN